MILWGDIATGHLGTTRRRVQRIETRGVWFVHEAHDTLRCYSISHEPTGASVAFYHGGELALRQALGLLRALPPDVGAKMAWRGKGATRAELLALAEALRPIRDAHPGWTAAGRGSLVDVMTGEAS